MRLHKRRACVRSSMPKPLRERSLRRNQGTPLSSLLPLSLLPPSLLLFFFFLFFLTGYFRHVENESKDLATKLDEEEKDKLQFKETIEKLEQEIKRMQEESKEEKNTNENKLANQETRLNAQIDLVRYVGGRERENREKKKEEE